MSSSSEKMSDQGEEIALACVLILRLYKEFV